MFSGSAPPPLSAARSPAGMASRPAGCGSAGCGSAGDAGCAPPRTPRKRPRVPERRDADVHVQQYGPDVGPALAAAFTAGFGFQASGASSRLPRQLLIGRVSPAAALPPAAFADLVRAARSAWLSGIVGRAYLVVAWDDWEAIPAAIDALRRAGRTVELASALRAPLPPGTPFSLAVAEGAALAEAWRAHESGDGDPRGVACVACAAGTSGAGRTPACYAHVAACLARTGRVAAWAAPENWSTPAGREMAAALRPHIGPHEHSWWGATHDAACVRAHILHRTSGWAAYEPHGAS